MFFCFFHLQTPELNEIETISTICGKNHVKMRQNTYETLVLHTMQLINSHYEWETNTGKMCDKCVGTRFVFND